MLKEQEITWRHAIDGTTSGPIATRWNVHAWPTLYLLDAKGVIRFKGGEARGKKMEVNVLKLLEEMGIKETKEY